VRQNDGDKLSACGLRDNAALPPGAQDIEGVQIGVEIRQKFRRILDKAKRRRVIPRGLRQF
jgi:hypothetical protein